MTCQRRDYMSRAGIVSPIVDKLTAGLLKYALATVLIKPLRSMMVWQILESALQTQRPKRGAKKTGVKKAAKKGTSA